MFGWPQVALLISLSGSPAGPAPSLAHPELRTVQALAGSWSCRLGADEITLRIAERHARPDQPASPVESFTVDLGGRPVERYGFKAGLITFDPRDHHLHFDADGKCTLPGPIDDDDDPDTGTQRCFRISGSSTPGTGGVQRWSLALTRAEEKPRTLVLELRQRSSRLLELRLRSGQRTMARGRCTSSASGGEAAQRL